MFRNLERRAVSHDDGLQRSGGAQIAIQLQEEMSTPPFVVNRFWIRWTDKTTRLKYGAVDVISESIAVAAELSSELAATRFAGAEGDRPVIVHAQAGLCHDVKNTAEPVAVFGWKPSRHHVDGLDKTRTDAR